MGTNVTNTVLVTGGAGFIGSALIRRLIHETDAHVVNVDKLTYAANLENISEEARSPRYRLFEADICSAPDMAQIIEQTRPDRIIHLAAESHVDRSIEGPLAFVQTNVVGTATLLSAAFQYWRGLPADAQASFRFLHVSTDEVFGSLEQNAYFTEETPYDPRSPYSASKASSDHLVRAWGHTYDLPVLVANCSNNYGPYQLPEKLIPRTILNALQGQPLSVYGDGLQARDWLHVDDHVQALLLILQRGVLGRTYAIGGDNVRTNLRVVERICDLVDAATPLTQSRRGLIRFVPDRPGHDRRYAIDASRIKRELGWAPKTDFESGLAQTVRWYLDHEAWWAPLRGHASRRLGLQLAPQTK